MVRILLIWLDRRDDPIWRNESGDVIHMAVCVIPNDSLVEPDHIRHSEKLLKAPLKLIPRYAWVSCLLVTQQALFRGQHRSASVHVDAAALEHNTMVSDVRLPGT